MAVSFTQTDFRLRNDDGSESTATWKAAANTSISLDVGLGNVNLRIRFAMKETGSTASTFAANIFMSKNGGAYAQVTAATANAKVVDSTNLTDNNATTQQLGAGTFVAGRVDDVDGTTTATSSIAQNSVTDFEFMVQLVSADLASGNTLDFRCYKSGVAVATYTNTPRITVLKSKTLTASLGTYTESGVSNSLLFGHKTSPDVGAYAESGVSTTLLFKHVLGTSVGAYTESGVNNALKWSRILAVGVGDYIETGIDVVFSKGRIIAVDVGNYNLVGNDISLPRSRILSALVGEYLEMGSSINLLFSRRLPANIGSYVLEGISNNLLYGRKLSANIGSYSFSGEIANILFKHVLGAGTGFYSVSGINTPLLFNRLMGASVGLYDLIGVDVSLMQGGGGGQNFTMNAGVGNYVLGGVSENLLWKRILAAGTRSYSVSGNNISFLFDRRLSGVSGIYNFAGLNVALTFSGEPIIITQGFVFVSDGPKGAISSYAEEKYTLRIIEKQKWEVIQKKP